MQTKSRFKGFTLVEILVVLAIISVLAALLFTVFGRVRENGRCATCQNNMRQIALGILQYVQDSDGNFSMNRMPSKVLSGITTKAIFKCPDAFSPDEKADENNYLLWEFNRHESTLKFTSKAFLVSEISGPKKLYSGYCLSKNEINLPHSGGSNYAFADGHVKWLSVDEAAKTLCANLLEE